MTEVTAAAVALGIPVVSELDLGALIARGGQEDQRIASLRIIAARQFDQAERVSVEAQRLLDVGHADHRMQILHGKLSRGAVGICRRIWSNPCTKANWAVSSSIAIRTTWRRPRGSGATPSGCRCTSCTAARTPPTGGSPM